MVFRQDTSTVRTVQYTCTIILHFENIGYYTTIVNSGWILVVDVWTILLKPTILVIRE